ncbi:ammonia-dependent NAD(+) synthetase [Williamsia sp. MIQD14]|uniref:ammonia-dependent NAD(+) synthetase n=1 Tax=Williamsia sp. MIQD14 TaxID=3425703 RepID=UPI003DA134D7
MMTVRHDIIDELRVRPTTTPRDEIDRRVTFLTDYVRATGTRGFTLGISGGQDSTLAGRLCRLAVDRLVDDGVEAEFVGVRLPYRDQADAADVDIALDFVAPTMVTSIDIAPAVDAGAQAVADALHIDRLSDLNRGNIKARERMIAQYAIAGERGLLVVGTDHAAEAVTGFFTKHGDGAADVTPLTGLTKGQGAELLRTLGAPESTWDKVPTADLEDDRPALPDEDALGVSYRDIDGYLEGRQVPAAAAETIEAAYSRTRHKRRPAVAPDDDWWR